MKPKAKKAYLLGMIDLYKAYEADIFWIIDIGVPPVAGVDKSIYEGVSGIVEAIEEALDNFSEKKLNLNSGILEEGKELVDCLEPEGPTEDYDFDEWKDIRQKILDYLDSVSKRLKA